MNFFHKTFVAALAATTVATAFAQTEKTPGTEDQVTMFLWMDGVNKLTGVTKNFRTAELCKKALINMISLERRYNRYGECMDAQANITAVCTSGVVNGRNTGVCNKP